MLVFGTSWVSTIETIFFFFYKQSYDNVQCDIRTILFTGICCVDDAGLSMI